MLHIASDCREDYVFRPVDVGPDAFERIVFGCRNVFQCRRVNDDIDAAHRHFQPIRIADVTDEIAKCRVSIGRQIQCHFVLLRFVPRKYDKACGIPFI